MEALKVLLVIVACSVSTGGFFLDRKTRQADSPGYIPPKYNHPDVLQAVQCVTKFTDSCPLVTESDFENEIDTSRPIFFDPPFCRTARLDALRQCARNTLAAENCNGKINLVGGMVTFLEGFCQNRLALVADLDCWSSGQLPRRLETCVTSEPTLHAECLVFPGCLRTAMESEPLCASLTRQVAFDLVMNASDVAFGEHCSRIPIF